jgi:anti-sigma factor RsiW
MSEAKCAEMREMLPAHARSEGTTLAVRRHLGRCSACRTELQRYEALLGSLAALPGHVADPPVDLFPKLVAIARPRKVEALKTHVSRNRKTYAGGLAVAAVGAAGAALWRSRTRRYAPA